MTTFPSLIAAGLLTVQPYEMLKIPTAVEPNRTRTPRLDLPVFLFHGTDDAHCPVQGVIDIGNRAREGGRTNVRTFIVPDHDHALEFLSWAVTGSLPEGLKILFDQVEKCATGAAIS